MPWRLYPPPSCGLSGGVYDDLDLPVPTTPERPYVAINMVASVDGVVSLGGKASGIGGVADRNAMRSLRSAVDAVMIGAGTLRAEKVNLGLDDYSREQPLAVIVAGSGPLPISESLVVTPGAKQRVLVATSDSTLPEFPGALPEGTELLQAPASTEGGLDLAGLLQRLRASYGVVRLLVEGGPTLNGALISAGLADELFLTMAPKLLSGDEEPSPMIQAPANLSQNLNLFSVHAASGELFLRYTLKTPPGDALTCL